MKTKQKGLQYSAHSTRSITQILNLALSCIHPCYISNSLTQLKWWIYLLGRLASSSATSVKIKQKVRLEKVKGRKKSFGKPKHCCSTFHSFDLSSSLHARCVSSFNKIFCIPPTQTSDYRAKAVSSPSFILKYFTAPIMSENGRKRCWIWEADKEKHILLCQDQESKSN